MNENVIERTNLDVLYEAVRAWRQDVDDDIWLQLIEVGEAIDKVLIENGYEPPEPVNQCPDCGGYGVGCCVNADIPLPGVER